MSSLPADEVGPLSVLRGSRGMRIGIVGHASLPLSLNEDRGEGLPTKNPPAPRPLPRATAAPVGA